MLKKPLKARFKQWMNQKNPPTASTVHLHNRRLYILPTRFGIMYSFLLFTIFLAAINYQNSLSFALSFLLTALGIVSLWQTHRNMLNLQVALAQPKAVYCGEALTLEFTITNPHPFIHFSIGLQYQSSSPVYMTLMPYKSVLATLQVPTTERGLFCLDGFTIFTRFPTGLFHCWGWLPFSHQFFVFPKPIATSMQDYTNALSEQENSLQQKQEGDDFDGLRDFRQGESLKHISWKALAQGRGKQTKIFHGHSLPSLWLDWDLIKASSYEEKLSKLTSLVIKADASNQQYGLKTPHSFIEKNSGAQHKRRCLEALACYKNTDIEQLYVSLS